MYEFSIQPFIIFKSRVIVCLVYLTYPVSREGRQNPNEKTNKHGHLLLVFIFPRHYPAFWTELRGPFGVRIKLQKSALYFPSKWAVPQVREECEHFRYRARLGIHYSHWA